MGRQVLEEGRGVQGRRSRLRIQIQSASDSLCSRRTWGSWKMISRIRWASGSSRMPPSLVRTDCIIAGDFAAGKRAAAVRNRHQTTAAEVSAAVQLRQ